MKNSPRATIVLMKRNRKLVRGDCYSACLARRKGRSLDRCHLVVASSSSLSLSPTQTQTQTHPFPLSKTTSNKSNLPLSSLLFLHILLIPPTRSARFRVLPSFSSSLPSFLPLLPSLLHRRVERAWVRGGGGETKEESVDEGDMVVPTELEKEEMGEGGRERGEWKEREEGEG